MLSKMVLDDAVTYLSVINGDEWIGCVSDKSFQLTRSGEKSGAAVRLTTFPVKLAVAKVSKYKYLRC